MIHLPSPYVQKQPNWIGIVDILFETTWFFFFLDNGRNNVNEVCIKVRRLYCLNNPIIVWSKVRRTDRNRLVDFGSKPTCSNIINIFIYCKVSSNVAVSHIETFAYTKHFVIFLNFRETLNSSYDRVSINSRKKLYNAFYLVWQVSSQCYLAWIKPYRTANTAIMNAISLLCLILAGQNAASDSHVCHTFNSCIVMLVRLTFIVKEQQCYNILLVYLSMFVPPLKISPLRKLCPGEYLPP